MRRVLVASFLSAIVCFLWGGLSWMVLDWHSSTIRHFEHEDLVVKTLTSAAPEYGVYMLPNWMGRTTRNPTAQSQEAEQKAKADLEAGPFAYAIVRPGPKLQRFGVDLSLVWAFLSSLGACFIVALLLRQTKRLDYIQKVGFCVLCGIFAGLVTDVPMLIWVEAPLRHTLINMADHLCEWFLAGLVIGALVQERESY